MPLAPIVLFTYKRLDTTKKTIESLKMNSLALDSVLYIYSDGPKNENDVLPVAKLRNYLKTIVGFKNIIIRESETNKGLATSIISGVSEVINKHEKVIVLEDDLLLTTNFLSFMNAALEVYKPDKEIFSISGFSFNLGKAPNEPFDAYFLNRGWSWGWATWQDRWLNVDWQVSTYNTFKEDLKARKEFAKGGSDLNAMLDKQMAERLDSWAVRWFYHQFLYKGLTVYPLFSKVFNNGFGKDATHTTGSNKRYIPVLDNSNLLDFKFPKLTEQDFFYQKKFRIKMGLFARLVSKIQTLFGIS